MINLGLVAIILVMLLRLDQFPTCNGKDLVYRNGLVDGYSMQYITKNTD